MALNFPDSPGIGSVFTDTTSGFSWEWTGAVWKSFTPAATQNVKNLDDISGSFDNSTQTFNLTINGVTYYPRAANMLQISLGGVIQEPDTDYTVDFNNGTITFTTAPNVGLDFFGVVRGTAIAIDYANDGNVQNKQNYTATEGQTAFTFSAGYTSGYLNVYRNGVKLRSTDFTETSSTVFTLNTPAQENDEIEAIGYVVASIVTTQGNLQNLNVTGVATISSNTFINSTGINVTGVITSSASVVGSAVTINNTGLDATGVITATSFSGDGSGLTGIAYVPSAGIATYATTAGIATYATTAGIATYSEISGISTYATTAGIATYATTAGIATSLLGGNVGVNTTSTPTNLYVSGNAAGSVVGLGTTDANTTLDFSTGNNFSLELTGSIVLSNPTGVTTGQSGIVLISQDGTGSRTCGFGSHWDFPSATPPTLSTGANALDALTYFVRNSTSIVTNSLIGIGTL